MMNIQNLTTKEKFALAFKLLDEAEILLDKIYNDCLKQEKDKDIQ